MKIKQNSKLLLTFLAVFIISAGFLFFPASNAMAAPEWVDKLTSTMSSMGNVLAHPFDSVLLLILGIVSMFLNITLTFFTWAIDGNTLTSILTADPIYTSWGIVRDLCNIGFILILLFSAFSTVFQYSKYNYKNILMWLVIMALLVNFSYPIALFVIDITNSLMYTLLINTFGDKTGSDMLFHSNIGFDVIQRYIKEADNKPPEAKTLFFLIIFVFILAMTIFSLALILLIRTIALALIVIFSPIGFVGTVIGKDGGWWSNLFKYAMAGPIIALVLKISIEIMKATASSQPFNDGGSDPIISSAAAFIIPIVVLWMGIAMAVKGIDGAGSIIGKAQGYAKTAGKKFSGFNMAKGQYDAFNASRKKRRDEMDKKKLGASFGDKINNIQDAGYAKVFSKKAQKRYNKRNEQSNKDDIKTESEKNDGVGTSDLASKTTDVLLVDPTTRKDYTKDKKIEQAGRAKQLLSRGKEFETELENQMHAGDLDTFITRNSATLGVAPVTGSGARLTGDQINKVKAAYYAEARKLIKEAEDHGKKEGDPYTHKAYNAVKNKLTP